MELYWKILLLGLPAAGGLAGLFVWRLAKRWAARRSLAHHLPRRRHGS